MLQEILDVNNARNAGAPKKVSPAYPVNSGDAFIYGKKGNGCV
jgi:hypothetical protein